MRKPGSSPLASMAMVTGASARTGTDRNSAPTRPRLARVRAMSVMPDTSPAIVTLPCRLLRRELEQRLLLGQHIDSAVRPHPHVADAGLEFGQQRLFGH